MGKIYGYARVSTKNQRLDRQIKNIEDYCKDKKIEQIYREKYTGTKMGRPQFQKLLAVVCTGDTIIFDSVSRMSRSADEGYDLYMQLLQEGYRIPADVLQRLYAEGWISGYLYKTVSGQPFTVADFKDVFDAAYYVSANPVIAAAVQNGTLPGDEMSLFLNYLTCGIPAGLNGSSSFSFAYFEEHYPQIAKALGNDKMAEAAYYILNRNSQHLKGNA